MEPPPAHSGQRATSLQQSAYRHPALPAATQAETNLFMDQFEMLRQQLQQYQEAPKANMTAAASKSPDLSSGISQYQQQSSYEDSTYKYPAPIQKYQETIADNKYKRDRQESSSRYDAVPQAHTKQVGLPVGFLPSLAN